MSDIMASPPHDRLEGLQASFPVLEDVTKRFGAHTVLDAVDLTLSAGGINCLLGPSGCGKSTLLRIAAGLIPPDSGVLLQAPARSAVVFQEPRLLPWLNVAENLSLALPGRSKFDRREAVARALDMVRLPGVEKRMPRELSGGMAQRAGIARAILRGPSFLLMDEPFAALDAITRIGLQGMLRDLIRAQNATCLFVTHDLGEALTIADRLFVLKQGRIRLDIPQPGRNPDAVRQTVMESLDS